MSNFQTAVLTFLLTAFLFWTQGGRRELEYTDEVRLRQELQYRFARWGMTWEMARWASERVPRAWL